MKRNGNYFFWLLLGIVTLGSGCNTRSSGRAECHYPNTQGVGYFEKYSEGQACAESAQRPLFLWFRLYAASTRKMEEVLLQYPANQQLLADSLVPVFLFCDDRALVNAQDSDGMTWGQQHVTFQKDRFQVNAQPYFVLLSPDGQFILDQFGYTPDPEAVHVRLKAALRKARNFKG